jgi:hypothetical protein
MLPSKVSMAVMWHHCLARTQYPPVAGHWHLAAEHLAKNQKKLQEIKFDIFLSNLVRGMEVDRYFDL